jgi:hypothetical protein
MPEKKPESETWPTRDEVTDEDGPRSSRDIPRERAEDARRHKGGPRSQDVDPDSARSPIDRDDASDDN